MPFSPKLRNVAAEIRYIEVPHQLYSKQLCRAYGNVRITRKVTINLEGEEDGGKKQGISALFRVCREYLIHIHRAIVCHHNLLEQAPQDLSHTINGSVIVEFPFLQELGQKVGRPFNGTGHQLREERDEGKEGDNVLGRLYLASVNIDRITQGLESIEGDANGKYHL